MSGFEFTFGLISLLLGLGLAHIAAAFANLILLGPRVKWDWLSPLAALLTFQSVLIYWWFQWSLREQEVVLGDLAIRAIACLALYIMAVAALPEPRGRRVDLKDHFERSQRLVYGSLIFYTLIVGVLPAARRGFVSQGEWVIPWFNFSNIALLTIGCFVRGRWLHAALLAYLVIILGIRWLPRVIAS
jgi:hypothetical protein